MYHYTSKTKTSGTTRMQWSQAFGLGRQVKNVEVHIQKSGQQKPSSHQALQAKGPVS